MGITLSSEQLVKVKERIKNEGLEDLVEVQLVDYREIKNKKFDKIVSVGMLEHVGKDHLAEYFEAINNILNDNGVYLLHFASLTHRTSLLWFGTHLNALLFVAALFLFSDVVNCELIETH